MENNCGIFVVKKLYSVNFFDFVWTWTHHFFNDLDYGWTWTEFQNFRTGSDRKIYDSPAMYHNVSVVLPLTPLWNVLLCLFNQSTWGGGQTGTPERGCITGALPLLPSESGGNGGIGALYNSIVSNFMNYQDRVQTNYFAAIRTHKIQNSRL